MTAAACAAIPPDRRPDRRGCQATPRAAQRCRHRRRSRRAALCAAGPSRGGPPPLRWARPAHLTPRRPDVARPARTQQRMAGTHPAASGQHAVAVLATPAAMHPAPAAVCGICSRASEHARRRSAGSRSSPPSTARHGRCAHAAADTSARRSQSTRVHWAVAVERRTPSRRAQRDAPGAHSRHGNWNAPSRETSRPSPARGQRGVPRAGRRRCSATLLRHRQSRRFRHHRRRCARSAARRTPELRRSRQCSSSSSVSPTWRTAARSRDRRDAARHDGGSRRCRRAETPLRPAAPFRQPASSTPTVNAPPRRRRVSAARPNRPDPHHRRRRARIPAQRRRPDRWPGRPQTGGVLWSGFGMRR